MQKKCVLIYDDDDQIREICEFLLSDEYRVQTFPSCKNLFADIENVKPGIILMGLWMPVFPWEKAIKALRENEATKDIPVIVFSAVTNIDSISNRIKATAILEKPFNIEQLKSVVSTFIL